MKTKLSEMKKVFSKQRCNAKQLGISFSISFEDWKDVWELSNQWENRGRELDQYYMSRRDITEGWTLKNVVIKRKQD